MSQLADAYRCGGAARGYDSAMNCANCARPLLSADAVCAYCEPEIRRLPPFTFEEDAVDQAAVPDAGRFACPACAKHFDKCLSVRFPKNARWWQLHSNGLACPHCRTWLRWQKQRLPSPTAWRLRWFAMAVLYVFFLGIESFTKDATQFWFAGHATAIRISIAVMWFVAIWLVLPTQVYQGSGHFVQATNPSFHLRQRWWCFSIAIALFAVFYLAPASSLPYLWLGMAFAAIASALAAWGLSRQNSYINDQ